MPVKTPRKVAPLPPALQRDLDVVRNNISLLEADVDRLKRLKITLESECASLNTNKEMATQKGDELDGLIAEKDARLKELTSFVNKKTAESGSLRKETADLQEACDQTKKELERLEGTKKVVSEDLEAKYDELSEAELALKVVKEKADKIAKGIKELAGL